MGLKVDKVVDEDVEEDMDEDMDKELDKKMDMEVDKEVDEFHSLSLTYSGYQILGFKSAGGETDWHLVVCPSDSLVLAIIIILGMASKA